MSTTENKKIFPRMVDEVWNKRQITAISLFYAPTLVEGTTAFVREYFAAFADLHVVIKELEFGNSKRRRSASFELR